MKRTLKDLIECFNKAKEYDYTYVGVKIAMDGFPQPEVIINSKSNFDKKLEYYQNAYDEDLTLKTFNGVRIIDFAYGDDFDTIEFELLT